MKERSVLGHKMGRGRDERNFFISFNGSLLWKNRKTTNIFPFSLSLSL